MYFNSRGGYYVYVCESYIQDASFSSTKSIISKIIAKVDFYRKDPQNGRSMLCRHEEGGPEPLQKVK